MLVADTAADGVQRGRILYAYADRCSVCGSGLTGAELEGALLACPAAHSVTTWSRAGRGMGGSGEAAPSSTAGVHLDPLPLLTENGEIWVREVPAEAVS